jgi:hypothetical protein
MLIEHKNSQSISENETLIFVGIVFSKMPCVIFPCNTHWVSQIFIYLFIYISIVTPSNTLSHGQYQNKGPSDYPTSKAPGVFRGLITKWNFSTSKDGVF